MLRVQHSENNQLYDSVCHTSPLDITVNCIIVRILLLLNTNLGANILFISLNVTGFLKTDWTVAQGLFDFIGPGNGYTCTQLQYTYSAITRLGWLVCFSRARFANPLNSWLRQWDQWRVLHGRLGCEIHISDRETSIYTIEAWLGLWLALLEPLASPNSTDQGIILIYNITLYYQPLCNKQ